MPKNDPDTPLVLITENPLDSLWEQLSAFESHRLACQFIKEKSLKSAILISNADLENKAMDFAYCIRTARELMRLPSVSMTTAAIANYYGCLWLASAIAIANPSSPASLSLIEEATKGGHGLGSFSNSSDSFPSGEFVYIKEKGFLGSFLAWTGLTADEIKNISWFGKRPDNEENSYSEKTHLLIPVMELFARIPELIDVFEKTTGLNAKCFELFYATSGLCCQPGPDDPPATLVGLRGNYSKQHLQDCGLPLSDLKEYTARNDYYAGSRWAGWAPQKMKFFDYVYEHPCDDTFYVSPMSGYYFISPLLKYINNPIAVHLILLYQLSILARYRPAIWRDIIEGPLDQYRILIAAYFRSFGRVIPNLVLTKLLGRRVRLRAPGTII